MIFVPGVEEITSGVPSISGEAERGRTRGRGRTALDHPKLERGGGEMIPTFQLLEPNNPVKP